MPKSPKARKESSKREREEGRMSEEGLNPFRKSSRTERSPSRSEERTQSKEIEKKVETVLREIKEDMAGIVEESRARRKELAAAREKEGEQEREDMLKSSEENGELRKELATVREEMKGREEKGQLEKADWMKRMEMIEEKMEQREKKERKNNVIITGIGAISGNIERGGGRKGDRGETGCRVGDEERENRNGKEGEEREKAQEVTRGYNVGSSKSLRHLIRYGCSAPACVLRIATVVTTADETEAFHRRRRETLRTGSHVMKGSTSDCVDPPTYGSFGRLPFFIATWITYPASTPLTSAKHSKSPVQEVKRVLQMPEYFYTIVQTPEHNKKPKQISDVTLDARFDDDTFPRKASPSRMTHCETPVLSLGRGSFRILFQSRFSSRTSLFAHVARINKQPNLNPVKQLGRRNRKQVRRTHHVKLAKLCE
ncbi:hypothetical protein GEV33_005901 [Tenebrio molitor]|uniref:Uncharacterized protein n=1 Tax=Tenebrio molitor TaxID=7067 RepID=A0A8J6LDN1_TENMO|nr:hypothetical protein GEV33_005901 [Tenebrio molitor]